jgi:AcrR family transcriptional regulator
MPAPAPLPGSIADSSSSAGAATPAPTPASAPRTARERVREEMTEEILAVAGAHVARDGTAALSLRSIARDLGMAPSALYRYFDGRDALLTALILTAYGALAAEAERAADQAETGAPGLRGGPAHDAERFLAVPSALRHWALEHPHQWGLIFGTPVPGYQAPEATVEPYARIAAALVRPLVAAEEAGRLRRDEDRRVSDGLRAAVRPVSEGLLPGMPVDKVVLVVQAWATLIGTISLEVFGHWRNTILEPELLFEDSVRRLGESLGLR